MEKPANTIAVIGLGLIGTSILKDIEKHAPQMRRLGYSVGHENEIAQVEGLIEREMTLEAVINAADILVIATPISAVRKTAEDIAALHTSQKKLIVIDVASVKTDISKTFAVLSGAYPSIRFIPTHPMGGSEKTGYEGARRGLFRGKPWVICVRLPI